MDIPVKKSTAFKVKRKWSVLLAMVSLIVAAILSRQFLVSAAPSVNQADIWISDVKQGNFVREVRGVGVLVPSEIRWIAAASAGRVERILVKPGALVRKDTVIAELSNPELASQLQQAQWELDAAKANMLALIAQMQEQTLEQELYVSKAMMELESAKLREQAEKTLADKHIISGIDFANTQLNTKQKHAELEIRKETQLRRADVVQAKLEAERANVRKFQNMRDLFQSQIDALTIRADIEGVLQQVSVDVGQRIVEGINIAQVARPDSLMAELQIQENMVEDLQIGLPVTVDTRNGLVSGKIKRIDPRVLNGNVQIDVTIEGDLPNGARPDLSVTGTITVENIESALYIDRPVGAAALSDIRLFTLNETRDKAEQRIIQLGKASVSSIQIISGLSYGEAVIVSDTTEFNQHKVISIAQ